MDHTTSFMIPSPSAFSNIYNLTEEEIKELGEFRMYVRCRSVNGASNDASYLIKSCVKPGPDLMYPQISRMNPESGSYLAYGQNQINLSFWVNEPANCKWSFNDITYEQMEKNIDCEKDLGSYTTLGWLCNTTLSGIGNVSQVYIKCQDTSPQNNTMIDSKPYFISLSASTLNITEISPTNGSEIITGVEPVSLNMTLRTSGGAENGAAVCSWGGNGYSDKFQTTGESYHKYYITTASRGDYNINFECKDAAGNIATTNTLFKISVDNIGPVITRMYYKGGLNILTDEDSECRYAFDKSTLWENATLMSGEDKEHITNLDWNTHYIQCQDKFGNLGTKIAVKLWDLL
jgi:hypothetical protein